MHLEYTVSEVAEYTSRQLNSFFPDRHAVAAPDLEPHVRRALERVEFCFKHIRYGSYFRDGQARFDVLHSDQYCTYLYYLANTVYRQEGDLRIASKLFYLNKALHSFNCMYDTELPDIFVLFHIVGTVLGKAKYSNFMAVGQNCTIGALRGVYPTLGERLILSANSSIIGPCRIGENVMLGPGVTVTKQDVPDNTVVLSETSTTLRPNSDRPFLFHFRDPADIDA